MAAEHHREFAGDFILSGNAEHSTRLLGGGLERGTNALLIGAAGVGKSSLALTYAIAATGRGERAVFFAFDEGRGTIEARARTLGLPLQPALTSASSAFSRSTQRRCHRASSQPHVQQSVEINQAKVVVIDSLNGYLNAMPDERFLILQMHELLSYLGQQGFLQSWCWRSMVWSDRWIRRST